MSKITFYISIFILLFANLNAQESSFEKKELYQNNKEFHIKKGKRIFSKMCKKNIDLKLYSSINNLKNSIKNKNLCKNLGDKQIYSVSIYLWETQRVNKKKSSTKEIHIHEKDKCPVCGMFIKKYPTWSVQIVYTFKQDKYQFSFDGVKDLMKFYLNPRKWSKKKISPNANIEILLRDYYTLNTINGKKAFFVIGSDVRGPMGKELLAFKKKDDAKSFIRDHKGTLLNFKEIKEEILYK